MNTDRDREFPTTVRGSRSRSRSTRHAAARRSSDRHPAGWRPGVFTWAIALLILTGAGVFLYPSVAQWVTSYNQSQIIQNAEAGTSDSDDNARQLQAARAYNAALSSGVQVKANTNVPVGDGTVSSGRFDYGDLLRMTSDGMMARLKIPSIGVDLPVYHGTSDQVLLQGSGHLEGSSLPVGGANTHAVLTAHRGLADATMFTSLRSQQGRDLVTLITCTPLGINTQRILVTGERILPTPAQDVADAGAPPDLPGFPWWLCGVSAALLLAGAYVWRSGYTDAVHRRAAGSRATRRTSSAR